MPNFRTEDPNSTTASTVLNNNNSIKRMANNHSSSFATTQRQAGYNSVFITISCLAYVQHHFNLKLRIRLKVLKRLSQPSMHSHSISGQKLFCIIFQNKSGSGSLSCLMFIFGIGYI